MHKTAADFLFGRKFFLFAKEICILENNSVAAGAICKFLIKYQSGYARKVKFGFGLVVLAGRILHLFSLPAFSLYFCKGNE